MTKIPPVLFQTSKKRQPRYILDLVKSKMPSNWSYLHFNDEEVIRFFSDNPTPEFPNIKEKYESFEIGAHKADLFRYYYLYLKGGFYIDTDVILNEEIPGILKNFNFVTVLGTMFPETIFNGFLAATPKHKIIYQALHGAYHCDAKAIYDDYLKLCRDLYGIILPYHDDPEVGLYKEAYYTNEALKLVDLEKKELPQPVSLHPVQEQRTHRTHR